MKQQRQAGFLLAKIRQVGERVFLRRLKGSGIEINPAQGRIMFALWQRDGVSIQELARKTQLGKSTLTSMLDRLEAMGYIQRRRSEDDRRKIMIYRTEKDRALEKQYADLSEQMTELWYKGFDETEIEQFEAYLGRILDNLVACEKNDG
ncbi:MAG: MarR family transcriptional regulator [Sedimentisphaerales bacterium]|nr:MarR family transcriptional regulator [Sedimentisphaerales bacterium]